MSTGQDTWDVVILGGGPPGENAAQYATERSDRTAVIIETELVGGECSYWACMPSKAMLRPLEAADAARSLPGPLVGSIDVAAVLERRDAFTSHHDDSSQVDWCHSIGVEVLRGRGRLTGPRTVGVTGADGGTRSVTARLAVVLATGSTAAVPDVDGLADALPWISRDVTNCREIPRRVAIVGGGVVACESATWLRGLGAEEVVIVERGPALLARQEPFAGQLLAERFDAVGVRVLTGRSVASVSRPEVVGTGTGRIHGGPAELTLDDGELLSVDEVVVAAGRVPSSSGIGLESVGVEVSRTSGFVPVDAHMTVPGVAGGWLYAVGDVTGKALLTHMGKYQARVAGSAIAARAEGLPLEGRAVDVADRGMVPAVVFTDPQVASVGLTEAAARQAGVDVEAVEYDLGSVAGAALLRDGYRGRAKLVVDRADDTLVGATFVGADVAELLHSATVAVAGKVPLSTLWHAVPSYPTISEVWLRLLEARGR